MTSCEISNLISNLNSNVGSICHEIAKEKLPGMSLNLNVTSGLNWETEKGNLKKHAGNVGINLKYLAFENFHQTFINKKMAGIDQ